MLLPTPPRRRSARCGSRRRAPLRSPWAAFLFAGLASAAPLAAQDPSDPPGWIEGAAQVGAGATNLAGEAAATLTVGFSIELRPGWWIGARGLWVANPVSAERLGPEREVSLGYGGVSVEWPLARWGLDAEVTVGAGLATLRDRVVGTRVGADVVWIVEPAFTRPLVRAGALTLGARAAYRVPLGVDGPEGVSSSDLRAIDLGLVLRFGGGARQDP